MSNSHLVAIALGSNLGDRNAHLDVAVARLSAFLTDLRESTRHDTAPVDVDDDQPRYLNAAVIGHTTLSPRNLLREMQAIEAEQGRLRPYTNAPRTLDLDLILYGSMRLDESGLTVPHPRFRQRAFVLEPLAEIGADLLDPVTGLSVRSLLDRLSSQTPIV
ncbi:MAG: 2-amino-4-hydroxy-6-hydroxymethyldihydropteridine diphosphokinase [Vicinamibacterales bacterium]